MTAWDTVLNYTPFLMNIKISPNAVDFKWSLCFRRTRLGIWIVNNAPVLFLAIQDAVKEITLLVGLGLFNDDTCPSGHISRPTQVNVSQSCFNSLNILLKFNYIVQVWGLVEANCVISDRRIPLLAGIPLCKSRELSRRGYSMSQLCSIHHDTPVTLHTPGAYGQWSEFDHNDDK